MFKVFGPVRVIATKLREVKGLLKRLSCQIHYVGRANNQEADALASCLTGSL